MTKNRSIYIGRVYNVKPPRENEANFDIVAVANFDYRRFYEAITNRGLEKMFGEESSTEFPFWKTDVVYDFEPYEAACLKNPYVLPSFPVK